MERPASLLKDTAGTAHQKAAKHGQDERIDVLQPQLDD
jgi:hypothetical protein